jgi:succinate dehydrogenase/fumarate reductase flavoprotein subunit
LVDADVVVVGSGGAGLAAAVAAAAAGARVTVLERTDLVGGTTAVSGGAMWIPRNDHMAEIGASDSREDALAYCAALTAGRTEPARIEHFVDHAFRVLRWLEASAPLATSVWRQPDYRQEQPGARPCGRSVEPLPFQTAELGPWAGRLRPSPMLTAPLTLDEGAALFARDPSRSADLGALVAERTAKGVVTVGNALVGRLLAGALERGVRVVTGARVVSLVRGAAGGRRVAGVRTASGDEIRAGAVILACGGYEWNTRLVAAFLPGIVTHPQSPPHNEGDGLLMAMEVGAALGNMHEAWWYPTVAIPGESYEGRPFHRAMGPERSLPGTLIVNRRGRRFTNEAANYNDMARSLLEFDVRGFGPRNLPAWSVFDAGFRRRGRVMTLGGADPDPAWLLRAETLPALATRAGIDPEGLVATVAAFNEMCAKGVDTEFGRGASLYDRATGDPHSPTPNLGPLSEPPFYALPVHLGCVGTKGGPRTDADAQVLDPREEPIPGLYAAGNVAAGISAGAYFGGGCSIGCGVYAGVHAGRHAAGSPGVPDVPAPPQRRRPS